MVFTKRHRGKSVCHISSYIPGARGCIDLLQQWNHIWNNSYNWSHYLIKFKIICCLSPRSVCCLHRPNKLNRNVVQITIAASFGHPTPYTHTEYIRSTDLLAHITSYKAPDAVHQLSECGVICLIHFPNLTQFSPVANAELCREGNYGKYTSSLAK